MEKHLNKSTTHALEKAASELNDLFKITSQEELQGALWSMFQDSPCRGYESAMPEDILIRTELYDILRNIFNELDKVPRTPGHAFSILYRPNPAES